jgi:hypothetical protein
MDQSLQKKQSKNLDHNIMLYDTGILTKTSSCMENKLQRLTAPLKIYEQRGRLFPHAVKEHEGTKNSLV